MITSLPTSSLASSWASSLQDVPRWVLALWPALIVMSYWLVAFAAFGFRTWRQGLALDAEVLGRPDSPMLSRFFRHFIMWLLAPWQRLLIKSGVSPNMLTFASLMAAAGSGVAAASGRFALAGWLYFLCGILDILDGRVARIRNQVTASGAFFDSVIDRYAELFVFAGMTYYYRDTWALGAVLLASLGSLMVSYTRARGEALGIKDLNIGMMQRPERLVYLGMSMIWAPFVEGTFGHGPLPANALVVAGLVLLAVSTNLTAMRRIKHTMLRLDGVSLAARSAGAPIAPIESRPERALPPAERPTAQPTASVGIVPLRAASGR